MAFFSSFGQTYFISLFNEPIRETFSLSHQDFGFIYSGATLVSGFTLMWAGRLIDRIDLRRFTATIGAGMILSCAVMAFSPGIVLLAIAIFMLRFFGQGMLGHISVTSMSRYFDRDRGKAISIGALGYPAGEALLPILAVLLIAAVGWRETWLIITALLLVVLIPVSRRLLRGHEDRHRALIARLSESACSPNAAGGAVTRLPTRRQWMLSEVLRDSRLYLLLPAALSPPLIATGMFFHQAHLAASKDWSLEWYAACFAGFAATQLPASLASGPLIDRIGARRLMPVFLIPMILGLIVLSRGAHPAIALLYLMLLGITIGMTSTTVNACLAELYGVLHLGSIRALSGALMVLSTALAPGGFGVLIQRQVSMDTIAIGAAAFAAVASALAWLALTRGANRGTEAAVGG